MTTKFNNAELAKQAKAAKSVSKVIECGSAKKAREVCDDLMQKGTKVFYKRVSGIYRIFSF